MIAHRPLTPSLDLHAPLPAVAGVEHGFVHVRGARLHYAEAGVGEPLILQHGWPQHWWMWRYLIGPLSERYRVICPDLRGFGWSDRPGRGYMKHELMEDVLGIADALGIDRFRYVGHDWGGHVGMLLALTHPERVERMVMMNFPLPWQLRLRHPREIKAYWYVGLVNVPLLGHAAIRWLRLPTVVLRWGRTRGAWTPFELGVYERAWRSRAAARVTVRMYRDWLLRETPAFVNGGFGGRRLAVPTRWISGRDDPVTRDTDGSYVPWAEEMTTEFVPDAGHFLPEERPDWVLARILDHFGATGPAVTPPPREPAQVR